MSFMSMLQHVFAKVLDSFPSETNQLCCKKNISFYNLDIESNLFIMFSSSNTFLSRQLEESMYQEVQIIVDV